MIIKKITLSIPESRAIEDDIAMTIKNQANIDYIAMMTDVNIPTEITPNNEEVAQ